MLGSAITIGASDVHFEPTKEDSLVRFRIDGLLYDVCRLEKKSYTFVLNRLKLVSGLKINVSNAAQDGRFTTTIKQEDIEIRTSVIPSEYGETVVMRVLDPKTISLSLTDLGLRQDDREIIDRELKRPNGTILVTGPTGSGKSTTLASMIDTINRERDAHILTIEDPIEYYHTHKKSIVNQREVGIDVPNFKEAIVRGVRMDPDVMMVGEMRDLETMESAITAAETGHLVFATLHTTGAARTVDRIIDAFPTTQQEQIRTQLASSIVAVISQLLIPRAKGKGRIASFEIMIATPSIQNLIRDKKTYRLHSDIQTGAKYGMITMDAHLSELYRREEITYDELMSHAYDLEEMGDQKEEENRRNIYKRIKGEA
ncbi:MAG: PilT/PilU family type 4a pilus ATPase [Chlamydiota bacterium]|nr:PilT/PilU family type 4a pilus ATPase [Chlamydiota bacterium]